jgi:hypothetical protein
MNYLRFGPDEQRFLPFCWVCRAKFGHSMKEERHHLIPRAYGGIDGPQVSLCDSHHTALHNIALRIYSKRKFTDLLTGSTEQDNKLIYLGKVAYDARVLTENDPNKKRVEVYAFDGDTFEKLRRLKTIYKGSREKIVIMAINHLHSKHFK